MKTNLIHCWLVANCFACAALGQSSFSLRNADAGVNAPIFDSRSVPLAGTDYLVELWGGTTTDSLTPTLAYWSRQRVIIPFLTGPEAGYFVDAYAGRGSTDDLCVFAVPPQGWAWLQVRAWAAHLGGTYEQASSLGRGGYGESPLFYAQGSAPGSTLGNPPASLIGLQSFSLLPEIPEPSSWAMFAIGGVVLWWKAKPQRKQFLRMKRTIGGQCWPCRHL
jgi:hypothetical protein